MSGTLVIIKPDGTRTEERHEGKGAPALEVLQRHVGGYIELVRVRLDDRVRDAYINEEGTLQDDAEFNQAATSLLAQPFDPKVLGNQLYGTVVIWVPDPKKEVPS